jgi:hypothetical protein
MTTINFAPILFSALLFLLIPDCYSTPASTADKQETMMASLHIDLQEGFENDSVLIRINSREVFKKERVQTKLLTGKAGSFKVDVPTGRLTLEVIVETRNLSTIVPIGIQESSYIGLSIIEGTIKVSPPSRTPFGYL